MACFQSISNEKPPLNTHWKLFSLETSLVFQKQRTWKVAAQHNLRQDYPTTPWPSSTGLWKKGRLARAVYSLAVGVTTKNLQDQTGWRKGSLSSWQNIPNNLLLADGNTGAETKQRLRTAGSEACRPRKPILGAMLRRDCLTEEESQPPQPEASGASDRPPGVLALTRCVDSFDNIPTGSALGRDASERGWPDWHFSCTAASSLLTLFHLPASKSAIPAVAILPSTAVGFTKW